MEEIKERAYIKVRCKINALNREEQDLIYQITTGKTDLEEDILYRMIDATNREMKVWEYMLTLIRNDDSII
jgi:hypothetical protein